jgi:metal-dependent amidase/aminoacylase/carboxypeptidase family protein
MHAYMIHMAILLGTAEVLASLKKELKGTVKFIFQPAEEGVQRRRRRRSTNGEGRRT